MKDVLLAAEKRFREKKYSFWMLYSAAFTGMFLLCFSWFFIAHKTFVWKFDAIEQHYMGMLYCSRLFKAIIKNLMSGAGFVIPMWDMSIGFGSDVFTAMNYYGLGDPFTILTVVVPEHHMDKFYIVLFFIKLYTAGWGFTIFSRRHKAGRLESVAGALLYCFSMWALFICLHQYCFLLPLLWFPYILNGVDNVLEQKNPLPFILPLTAAAISNFYFLYMMVVLAVGYAVFRYVTEFRPIIFKDAASTVLRFLVYGAASMMSASIILYPAVRVMMTSSRYGADRIVSVFYPLKFYLELLPSFAGDFIPSSYTLLGYTPIGLIAVVLMFTLKGQYRRLKIVFCALTLCLVIPFFGFALNGFAYATNRWGWCYTLLISYIVARMIPHFTELSLSQKKVIAVSACVFVLNTALTKFTRTKGGVSLCVLYASIVLILLMTSEMKKRMINYVVIACLLAGIFVNAYNEYSEYGDNAGVAPFLYFHESNERLTAYGADSLTEDDDSAYRIEEIGTDFTRNSSDIRGKMTTNYYLSMTEKYVPEFILKSGLNAERTYMYQNLGDRSILQKLLGIKYLYVKDGSEDRVPADFRDTGKTVDANGETVHLYEADNALGLGFMLPSYITRSEWEEMSLSERQTALLNAVVIEDKDSDAVTVPHADAEKVSAGAVSVMQDIEGSSAVEIKEDKIFVKKSGASIKIKINPAKNSELYVIFKGLDFQNKSKREEYRESEWNNLSFYERAAVRDEDFLSDEDDTVNIGASVGDDMEHYRSINFMNHRNIYYCGQEDFLLSLGDFEDTGDTVRIHFQKAGVYDLSDIDVVAEPVDSIESAAERASKEQITDLTIGTNTISGTISAENDGLLFLSIPYNTGWKAFVDGAETEIHQSDAAFMSLDIKEGTHAVELRYESPDIRTGALLSMGGILLTVVSMILFMIKKKKG
ncbi:Uncharacterized membrane protein YfhO [Lachnospiraceae bacterium]|nr:Uncharacterized membrane protein YfhO [Lachnospiraceae bacterium]